MWVEAAGWAPVCPQPRAGSLPSALCQPGTLEGKAEIPTGCVCRHLCVRVRAPALPSLPWPPVWFLPVPQASAATWFP